VITQTAKKLARSTKDNSVVRVLARVGYAVNGLIHILIGVIAIGIATGTASADADEAGALGQLATSPGAAFILWTVVIGLVALGIWMLLTAFLNTDPDPKHKWAHRIADLGKALAYFIVAGTAVTIALGNSAGSEGGTSSASAQILATPGGVFVLLAAGVAVLAVGCYFIYKGVTRKFRSDIDAPNGTIGRATIVLGVTGYVAKGVAIAVVGILLAVAAFTLDASKAEGLDGSLRALLGLPFGVAILCVVGSGLMAYGVYCFARARLARLH
jgi:Domain of Unknown Function (DUF1206)